MNLSIINSSVEEVKRKRVRAQFIKTFMVKGLFNNRTVKINFETDTKILIGENGLGKTTLLNILYYILSNKFHKLKTIEFKEISLTFIDGKSFVIKKEYLNYGDENESFSAPPSLIRDLSRVLSKDDIFTISTAFEKGLPSRLIIDRYIERRDYTRHYPMPYVINALKIICGFAENNEHIRKAKDILKEKLENIEVLYFPTYRRIEEDLVNLGIIDSTTNIKSGDTVLIQFGMKDVKEKLDEVKKEINNLSSKGLSQISSEILSQLVKGLPNIDENTLINISIQDIKIILARVGDAISTEDKLQIIALVEAKKFKDSDDKYLIYFLQKLIEIYEKQKDIDIEINNFVSTCNHYLDMSDKQLYYDPSKVEFYFIDRANDSRTLLSNILDKLSSGEKQILSLFSKIYLNSNKNFLVLFDEPELSLSIFWQRQLLPDILEAQRCKFLLAVTHSPFIFENYLEQEAIGLNQYIKQ